MREPWPNGRAHGFVLIVALVVGKCLSKLVGVSHGLMGELMVLNRFFVFLVGGYLSQYGGVSVSPLFLLLLGSVDCWLVSSYMLDRGTGLKNSYL